MAEYRFLTTWLLEADRERVWDAIYDSERWPEWWRGVEEAEKLAEGDERGHRPARPLRLEGEAPLPGRVLRSAPPGSSAHTCSRATRRASWPGVGRWRLFEQGGVTAVVYEWNVHTTKAWMNLLAPVARPVFQANHDYVMRNGGEGIAKLLGARLLARRLTLRLTAWLYSVALALSP